MAKITLIRGLPGAGKTTLARQIAKETGAKHYEADQFFIVDGEYKYDAALIPSAHKWCRRSALLALIEGFDVVVANTFTRHWEMKPYLDIAKEHGAEVEIITANGRFPNVHGVPEEVIQKMVERWEE